MSSHTNPSLCEFGYCHDPVEGSENQIGVTAACMNENSELVARKQGAHLADVKLEPALEGYEIGPSGSPQANSTHAKGSVPSLGVKDELTDCELPGLCENVSFSSRQRRKRKTRYAAAMTCFILYLMLHTMLMNSIFADIQLKKRLKKTLTLSRRVLLTVLVEGGRKQPRTLH